VRGLSPKTARFAQMAEGIGVLLAVLLDILGPCMRCI
jgi:hypothetical protein